MRIAIRGAAVVTVIAGLLLAVAALGLRIPVGGTQVAATGPIAEVGIDANPIGNTATSVGTIEDCIEVGNDVDFEIDIYVKGIPGDDGMAGYEYDFLFDDTLVSVTGYDHGYMLEAMAGCGPYFEQSDPLPDTSSPWYSGVTDLGGAGCNENGDGVLTRLTLHSAVSGDRLATLRLGAMGTLTFVYTEDYPDGAPVSRIGSATVAVNQPCPTLTPTPTPSPSPTPTATPTPVPWPTPPPPAGTVYLVSGWNDSCYVGPAQPIETALATIADPILALYRMRPDQGFDSWFPARPDLSTITTLNPYDQLFILMAQDATWTHQPSDTPPTSASLTAGWNSVCYAGTAKDIEAATATIAGQFGVIYTLASDQTWRRFVPAKPELSNLSQLQHSTSVLILVTEQGGTTWAFDP